MYLKQWQLKEMFVELSLVMTTLKKTKISIFNEKLYDECENNWNEKLRLRTRYQITGELFISASCFCCLLGTHFECCINIVANNNLEENCHLFVEQKKILAHNKI